MGEANEVGACGSLGMSVASVQGSMEGNVEHPHMCSFSFSHNGLTQHQVIN